jgi:signal transduction histidine kinase
VTPLKRLVQKSQNFEYKDQAFKLLQVMNDGLRLTFDIMNSLRTYSGLNHAAVKDHNVLELVQSTLTIIKNRIPLGVRIELNIPENLELTVNAAAINQVLMNLIVNALDAIGESGLVKISATTQDDRIMLKIQDDGPGVPQNIQDKVFDPFFTTKDVGKGTGLGLHISKREILKHGGSLGLESNSQHGSVFTIDLPKNPIGEHITCSL